MRLSDAFEPLLRRVWRRRWTAVARAEFRRSFGAGAALSLLFLALLAYAGAVWALAVWKFEIASAVTRGILCATWFICSAASGALGKILVIDDRLAVTEAWLLTSEPRERLLWARLAGNSLPGPLLVALLAPLYLIGVAGMSARHWPLFICGYAPRAFTCWTPPDYSLSAGLLGALPVAAMAMLADAFASTLAGSGALIAALQGVCRKRFWSDVGRFFRKQLSFIGRTIAIVFIMSLIEGTCVAAAAWWYYHGDYIKPSPPLIVPLGLLSALLVAAALLAGRWLLAGHNVGVAGRNYDAVLLEDDPTGGLAPGGRTR